MNKRLHFIIIIILLLVSSRAYPQGPWEWSDPAPLTDSVSDNINADLFFSWESSESLFMVWQKSFDTISTAIYFDNILDTIAPIAVLSDPTIHYSHPRIMDATNAQYPDEELYIFYETTQNGSLDIHYITYMSDGSFSQPIALVNTLGDETNFDIGKESIWWDKSGYCKNAVSYSRNDSLFIINLMQDGSSIYWSEESFIDFPVNDRPLTFGAGYGAEVKYLKADTIDKHIFHTWCDQEGNWSMPEVFFDSTDCRNMDDILHYGGLIWSTYRDSAWKITHNSYYPGYYTYHISKETPFDPAAIGFAIGVDFLDGWVFIPYSENDTNEIYVSNEPWPWGIEFIDFTNSNTFNRNPNTYEGEPDYGGYCWFDYLVWESYRNGHWQIWHSKTIQCAGNVEEHSAEQIITIYPNPASDVLNIKSEIQIDHLRIIDINGKVMHETRNQNTQMSIPTGKLPGGIYILEATCGSTHYKKKFIINHQ